MLITIWNLRNRAQSEPMPMKIKAKKRYVPKTELNMFATGEQTYRNGNVSTVHTINSLCKRGSNVVLGVLEARERSKAYNQFDQVKRGIVENGKIVGYNWEYTRELGKGGRTNKLKTEAFDIEIDDLMNVNEIFTKVLYAYGYTTELFLANIKAKRAAKELVKLNIRSYITFVVKGTKHTLKISSLSIKDAWQGEKGIRFNFAKKDVDEYKSLIAEVL